MMATDYRARYTPGQLPVTVTPILDETVDSFIARLAAANHLTGRELRAWIANDPAARAPVPAPRLAAVAGLSATRLRYALLELADQQQLTTMRINGRPRNLIRQGGCERCQAGHGGLNGPVRPVVWARHEDTVCLRHLRWIRTGPQEGSVDLSAQPDIVAANRTHRALLRRNGRAPVLAGYRAAVRILHGWGIQNTGPTGVAFERRMLRLLGEGWTANPTDAAYQASYYPEVVALTRLLSTPYWRSLILDSHLRRDDPAVAGLTYAEAVGAGDFVLLRTSPGIEAFVAEAQRTVTAYFGWEPDRMQFTRSTRTPFATWVLQELEARFADEPAASRAWSTPVEDVHGVTLPEPAGSSGRTPTGPSAKAPDILAAAKTPPNGEPASAVTAARPGTTLTTPRTNPDVRSRWARFEDYCATVDIDPNDGLVSLDRQIRADLFTGFVEHLAQPTAAHPAGLKAITARNYLATVQNCLTAANREITSREFTAARTAIRDRAARAGRIKQDTGQGWSPPARTPASFNDAEMKAMAATLDPDTDRGARDLAILLLQYATAATPAQIARLQVTDVTRRFGRGVAVMLRRTGSRAPADRVVEVDYALDVHLCAVLAYQAWLERRRSCGAAGIGPLFPAIDRHGNWGLQAAGRHATDGRVADDWPTRVLKAAAIEASISGAEAISGRSMRNDRRDSWFHGTTGARQSVDGTAWTLSGFDLAAPPLE
jgi:integrase